MQPPLPLRETGRPDHPPATGRRRQAAALACAATGGVIVAVVLTGVLIWGLTVLSFMIGATLSLLGTPASTDWVELTVRFAPFPLACLLLPLPLAWWWARGTARGHPAVIGFASAAVVAASVVGILWLMVA